MTLADFSNIATVISSAAVLVSLIYLALQTRQNSKHTRALIQLGRADEVMNELTARSEPSNALLLSRGYAGDETLNSVEVSQFLSMLMRNFIALSESFHQQRDGLIDEARHAIFENALRWECSRVGSRAFWRLRGDVFDPAFRNYVDKIIAQSGPSQTFDAAALWKAAIGEQNSAMRNVV